VITQKIGEKFSEVN